MTSAADQPRLQAVCCRRASRSGGWKKQSEGAFAGEPITSLCVSAGVSAQLSPAFTSLPACAMPKPRLRSPRQRDCSRHPCAGGSSRGVCWQPGCRAIISSTPQQCLRGELCESAARSPGEVLSVGGELCTRSHPKGAKEGLELLWSSSGPAGADVIAAVLRVVEPRVQSTLCEKHLEPLVKAEVKFHPCWLQGRCLILTAVIYGAGGDCPVQHWSVPLHPPEAVLRVLELVRLGPPSGVKQR